MGERLLQFAALLFRGDEAAMNAAQEALAQPASFIARYTAELPYVRPKAGWFPKPWPLLLDVAQLRGWVCIADWRESPDEIAAAVQALAPAAPLGVDWDRLAATHADSDTRAFLGVLARAAAPTGEALVSLDRGSDDYPLALLPAGSLAEASRLAMAVSGRIDDLRVENGNVK